MSFKPRTLSDGRVCCSNPTALCDPCKAYHAAFKAALRTAAGARHSAADQAHLDAAADHLVQAGAQVPAGAAGSKAKEIDATINEHEKALSSGASFKERYAAEQTRMFARLRAETREYEARAAARPPEIRALEAPDEVPDGYRVALENRAPVPSDLTPDLDPGYEPFGQPPDAYKLALALRTINAKGE